MWYSQTVWNKTLQSWSYLRGNNELNDVSFTSLHVCLLASKACEHNVMVTAWSFSNVVEVLVRYTAGLVTRRSKIRALICYTLVTQT